MPTSNSHQPQIITRDHHPISRKVISKSALRVLYGLKDAGFAALLVGGCVRDLLLGHHPKDYDIATDATPEEVEALFRRSRIIGRRFRIVHVRFGREIIEVTTFRGHHTNSSHPEKSSTSHSGMLLRDNVFGSIEEDALRRDFTVNSLFYNIADFTVLDYTNGLQDLQDKVLRVIGDPLERFQEDPVRMLRAARFAAKLDFDIEDEAKALVLQQAPLLSGIPAARLFDEVLKLFMGGYATACYYQLREYNLFGELFPAAQKCLDHDQAYAEKLIVEALKNTDKRIQDGKPVTPAFLFAALLWPATRAKQLEFEADGANSYQALQMAAEFVTALQVHRTSIPRRFSTPMRQIWELHHRMLYRANRRRNSLIENPRFRAAYDFILLREQSGEDLQKMGQWWTAVQEGQTTAPPPNYKPNPRKRRSPKRGPRK